MPPPKKKTKRHFPNRLNLFIIKMKKARLLEQQPLVDTPLISTSRVQDVPAILEQWGVVILKGVLSLQECTAFKQGLHLHMKKILPSFDPNDATTWRQFIQMTHPSHGMLHQHHRLGMCQAVCDIRQNPKCMRPFALLWDTEELCTSQDGVAIGFPPEITHKGMSFCLCWSTFS